MGQEALPSIIGLARGHEHRGGGRLGEVERQRAWAVVFVEPLPRVVHVLLDVRVDVALLAQHPDRTVAQRHRRPLGDVTPLQM